MKVFLKLYRAVVEWLFSDMREPVYWWKAILWWELRRIPYNLIVGVYGFLSLIVFYLALNFSGHLKPGEDAVEPISLIIAPFIINILYTLGWFTELLARMAHSTYFAYSPTIRPHIGLFSASCNYWALNHKQYKLFIIRQKTS